MTTELVSSEVRTFIVKYIHSIAQLEVLLLLRSHPNEKWTASKVVSRIYASEAELTTALERLCAQGLLTCNKGIYRYDSDDTKHRELVDKVAILYSTHLIPLTNIIHDRDRHLREFSDAFKLKGDL